MADDCEGRAGQTNIDGIRRLRTPLVRTAEGKGRFLNVTCLWFLKFRNFESISQR